MKLPVIATILEVLVETSLGGGRYLKAAPFHLLMSATGFALYLLSAYRSGVYDWLVLWGFGISARDGPLALRLGGPEYWIGVFLILAGLILATARWYRLVLSDERHSLFLHRADRVFFIAWLKVQIIDLALALAGALLFVRLVTYTVDLNLRSSLPLSLGTLSLIFMLVRWVGGLLVEVIDVRITMLLPGAAIEEQRSLWRAVWASHGNTWRLVVCDVLLSLPVNVLRVGVLAAASYWSWQEGAAYGTIAGGPGLIILFLLGVPLFLYSHMLQTTLFAVAYREIIGLPEDTRSPEVTA